HQRGLGRGARPGRAPAVPGAPGGGEDLGELHAHRDQPRRPLQPAASRQRHLPARAGPWTPGGAHLSGGAQPRLPRLPGGDGEGGAGLGRIVGDTAVRLTFTLPGNVADGPRRPVDPVDPELLAAVNTLARSMWGEVPVIPMMSMWATDGVYLRAAGIPTYGV